MGYSYGDNQSALGELEGSPQCVVAFNRIFNDVKLISEVNDIGRCDGGISLKMRVPTDRFNTAGFEVSDVFTATTSIVKNRPAGRDNSVGKGKHHGFRLPETYDRRALSPHSHLIDVPRRHDLNIVDGTPYFSLARGSQNESTPYEPGITESCRSVGLGSQAS